MSGALSALSDSTMEQRRLLDNMEAEYEKLQEEEKRLEQIEKENKEKEEHIDKVLEKLKK